MSDFSQPEILITAAYWLVGAFYMFGGFAVVKAVAMDVLIDHALATLDPDSSEMKLPKGWSFKQIFLTIMAIFTFAGGAFLLVQSAFATTVFCLCLATQAIYYFFAAPRLLTSEEEYDGRASGINAMILYAVVTIMLFIAQQFSYLPPLSSAWTMRDLIASTAVIAFAAYALLLTQINEPKDAMEDQHDQPEIEDQYEEPLAPIVIGINEQILVQVEEFSWGIWRHDGEIWQAIDAHRLGISKALADRIIEWEDSYDEHWDLDDPAEGPRWNPSEIKRHYVEAEGIAKALKIELQKTGHDTLKISWARENGEICVV